jgi:hypothetical protein
LSIRTATGECEDLIELGLARTTTFSHEHSREFGRLREEAEGPRLEPK